MRNGMRPIHLGEILKADFLDALGMSASALAKALGVPANRIIDFFTGVVELSEVEVVFGTGPMEQDRGEHKQGS